ncbi:nicotinamidase-related amidase [Flavobacterium araucananum]|uniref:Cysteine hydrolase n=1 Tax=Flavobacterium araucananum TaxID=946678 RepID=A0A227P4S8_9FLAO|nr:cysteine hydrolase family protein [Flavobacterium araucananum]OXG04394.1 cysteine hydrolase [Flavobacterium araucananum]PWK01206.1 nicotinamidase-related amidase [Flavobacterium araucananum]
MKLRDQNTALILIDVQKGFNDEEYWGGNRNNKDAETKMIQILKQWRTLELPVFHIVHSSLQPNSKLHGSHPGFEIKDEVKPVAGEPVITKNVNSAFIGTDLKERLDALKINKLVIVGLTTNHCVSTTTRMAGNLGFDVYLISDATATFDRIGINGEKYEAELVHQISLASLHNEFANVIDTAKLLELV